MKNNNTLRQYFPQLILVVTIFLFKTLFNLIMFKSLTSFTGADEFGTIVGATFLLNDINFSEVAAFTIYYGYGFSILMTPVFLLFHSPLIIYQILLGYNTICLCFCALICYKIITEYFDVKDPIIAALISLSSILFVDNIVESNSISNEAPLILILWITLLLLLTLQKNRTSMFSCTKTSILLGLILAYGFTIHTRIIFIWGAVAVFAIIYFLYNKKLLFNPLAFLPAFGIGFFFTSKIVNTIQHIIWTPNASNDSSSVAIANSVADISNKLSGTPALFSLSGIRAFIFNFIGELYGAFTITGGFFSISIIVALIIMLSLFSRNKKIDNINSYFVNSCITIIILFFTIVTLTSLNGLGGTISALSDNTAYKFILYMRYWALCAGPLCMITMTYLYHYQQNHGRIISLLIPSSVLYLFVLITFTVKIAPYFTGISNVSSGVYFCYAGLMGLSAGDQFQLSSFIQLGIISFLIFTLHFIFMKRLKFAWNITLYIVFISFSILSVAFIFQRPASENAYIEFDAMQSVMDSQDSDCSDIYVTFGEFNYSANAQFRFLDYTIHPNKTPDSDSHESAYIISDRPLDEYELLLEQEDSYFKDTIYFYKTK